MRTTSIRRHRQDTMGDLARFLCDELRLGRVCSDTAETPAKRVTIAFAEGDGGNGLVIKDGNRSYFISGDGADIEVTVAVC